MRIWMPYVSGGSGSEVAARYLAAALERAGCEVITQAFHRYYQFAPHVLARVKEPAGTSVTISNTRNGFAFQRSGTPMVTVEHLCVADPALEPYKTRLQRAYHASLVRHLVQRSAASATANVAVSEYTARVLWDQLAIHATPIQNGVDVNYFSPATGERKQSYGRQNELLFVGNPSRRKGADLLGPIVDRLGSNYVLRYTSGLQQRRLVNDSPRLRPLGKLNPCEVRDAYRRADVLIFPSRGEGLPLTVLEAMACGTPVVASDVSSLPEALRYGGGILCEPDNPDALAEGVKEAIARRQALSQEARQAAITHYSLTRMANDYLSLFQRL